MEDLLQLVAEHYAAEQAVKAAKEQRSVVFRKIIDWLDREGLFDPDASQKFDNFQIRDSRHSVTIRHRHVAATERLEIEAREIVRLKPRKES